MQGFASFFDGQIGLFYALQTAFLALHSLKRSNHFTERLGVDFIVRFIPNVFYFRSL